MGSSGRFPESMWFPYIDWFKGMLVVRDVKMGFGTWIDVVVINREKLILL
jgi:hypothetical protein